MSDMWDSFWWNAPVRTFTELYIEISLAFFINTLNIKFLTISGVIVTTIMFISGIFVLFWPFVVFNLISSPPKMVKLSKFDKKYGTLTEDFHVSRTLVQRAYYPLFVFQRILITGILVLMYDVPLLQIMLILIIQIAMIVYLIKFKPFKFELQQVI